MPARWKAELVERLAKAAAGSKCIGLVSLKGFPAAALQRIRSELEGKIVVARKALLLRALQASGLAQLQRVLADMPVPGLVLSDRPATAVQAALSKIVISLPLKPGEICPEDISIPPGPTKFSPGPIVSELGKFGIKAGVEGGKVVIKAGAVVAKAGQRVSPELASILQKLGVKPLKLSLRLAAALSDSLFFSPELFSELESLPKQLGAAAAHARSLALSICWITPENAMHFIQEAARAALALALAAAWPSPDTIAQLLALAHAQAKALGG